VTGNGESRIDLVLEGGGVKGIGLVGAVSVLHERGFRPQNLAGTSAGAIAACLLAAGYEPEELRALLFELDFNEFKDRAWEDRIGGPPLSIVKDHGMYEGRHFLEWMRGRLEEKSVRTFGDLVHPDFADTPEYRYRAQVIASDITDRTLLVLPRDAERFGVDPDELGVAEAVRMSMGIPIFFEPWRWRSEVDGSVHQIVDGGVLSNFPVWLFDSEGEPDWPTFGLLLVEPEPQKPVAERLERPNEARTGIVEFLRALVQTMLEAHDRMYLDNASFVRTIQVPTLGVRTTEFDLSPERAQALYDSGREATTAFLDEWDFEAYKRGFRDGKVPSRRELIRLAGLGGGERLDGGSS
jgi:NTE family protein